MKADDLMYRDGLINNAAVNFVSRTGDLSHRAFDAVGHVQGRDQCHDPVTCGRVGQPWYPA
ncbi:hypothetical protein [Marinobacter daqiaonensis]|uniref:hypothetical protein n=1 Tax=Marinobacter daqiaonensis TaxID=650891 RepID=UPI00157FDE76|nr:hypothetical protein [Marinobacter daqiaonensis]